MRQDFRIQSMILPAALFWLIIGMPVGAKQLDPFPYTFVMTPEEGPIDPKIERRHTVAFNQCQKRAVSTQANEGCFAAEFLRQDNALNHTWHMAFARTPPRLRKTLIAAQRKWVAERDHFC